MKQLVALSMVVSLMGAAPLLADKPKGKGKPHDSDDAVLFTVTQRETAQAYFVGKHGRGGCPPGLAKKGNGCLPPGQAKKRYSVGHAVPKGVAVEPVPAELSIRIGAPPAGYVYAVVDGDLVKLAVGTMLVVDAIDALVH
jgi:hypothetical protein